MEVRKLQLTGGSSLTLTLPKKWVEKNKLKDKDAIRILENDSHYLLLQPPQGKRLLVQTTIDADHLTSRMLVREIIACYITGVDEVMIVSKHLLPEQRVSIRKMCNALIGFEMIDESATRISLQNIFDYTKLPVEQNVQKILAITKSMFTDACRSLRMSDITLARDVIERDFEVDKLYWALCRQYYLCMNDISLKEMMGIDHFDVHYYRSVATQLERIADHAVKIAHTVLHTPSLRESTSADITRISDWERSITGFMDDVRLMVGKRDKKLAHRLLDTLEDEGKNLPADKNGSNKPRYDFLLVDQSFERIRGYLRNIAEMTIDHAIIKEKT